MRKNIMGIGALPQPPTPFPLIPETANVDVNTYLDWRMKPNQENAVHNFEIAEKCE